MKTTGLVGGMSWESSLEYYRLINTGIRERLGGLHSAKILMYSTDFKEIAQMQSEARWEQAAELMKSIVNTLKKGGADFVLICTNTMHFLADEIEKSTDIPLLHIADATAGEIKRHGIRKAALLGTRFTMEKDFYRKRLAEKHGIEVIIPENDERKIIHDIIYDELCRGIRLETSRDKYRRIISGLADKGVEGVILGCTEIGLLLREGDTDIPLFDTTVIHAAAAVEYALKH
ncbi:MAG: aspartate racemase [Lentisphaerae bacterium GWF2_44_16]|nr:MAG: aspartate racemase [Lentisphaerae bacterium GWF2_44_16]